ncbi:DUF998 domain-containing protein [Humibacter sp. RRB41]|uniref:DUF998 domain-containing protein n=1 Tax=Humibacter sp. RRB41 TaxID=2919946 RepID=UPI001FA9CAFD|nr:DUF998 domain-containing protein [Humibacter sp. RRB41]
MTNPEAQPATRSYLPLAAVAGPMLFTLAWFTLGFVSTGYTLWGVHVSHYSPIQAQVSALGVGNTAPYMNVAFIITGVLLILGAIGIFRVLRDDIPSGSMRRWCFALWLLPGIGSITDGIFTFQNTFLHFLGFGLFLTSVFAFALTGIALRRTVRLKRIGTWLIIAVPLTIALTILFFSTFTPTAAGQLTGIAGVTERLLVTEIMFWYATLGWIAFRTASGARFSPSENVDELVP